MTAEYKVTLTPIELETAQPDARSVLEKAKAQVGFIPNMYKGMVNYPELLETYLEGYNRFRKTSNLSPVEQEIVLLSISRINGCGYCTAAHSMIADRAKMPSDVLAALRSGGEIPDSRLAALHAFTKSMVEDRGTPSQSATTAFLTAGFSERNMLEIVLAISVKVISNFSNHLFHTEIDKVFAPYAKQQGAELPNS